MANTEAMKLSRRRNTIEKLKLSPDVLSKFVGVVKHSDMVKLFEVSKVNSVSDAIQYAVEFTLNSFEKEHKQEIANDIPNTNTVDQ